MKLPKDHYLRINSDGSSHEVSVQVTERKVTEKLLEVFTGNIPRHVKRIFEVESTGGTAQMVETNAEMFVVARLQKITLNCRFALNADKILTPVFIHKDKIKESDGLIEASPEWSVPEDMMLLFAARIGDYKNMECRPFTHPDQSCYLIAYDGEKRAWKLPLSNIYGDCAICMGNFNGSSKTIKGAFELALEQFRKSDWNSDLAEGHEKSNQLFRFKTEKKSTVSILPEKHWSTLCTKISTPVSMLIGGLL